MQDLGEQFGSLPPFSNTLIPFLLFYFSFVTTLSNIYMKYTLISLRKAVGRLILLSFPWLQDYEKVNFSLWSLFSIMILCKMTCRIMFKLDFLLIPSMTPESWLGHRDVKVTNRLISQQIWRLFKGNGLVKRIGGVLEKSTLCLQFFSISWLL